MKTETENKAETVKETEDVAIDVPRLVLPTDDSLKSRKARKDAVEDGRVPVMPRLQSMKKKEMAELLQDIWSLCDEIGVERRNPTSPQNILTLYGRVLTGFKSDANDKIW